MPYQIRTTFGEHLECVHGFDEAAGIKSTWEADGYRAEITVIPVSTSRQNWIDDPRRQFRWPSIWNWLSLLAIAAALVTLMYLAVKLSMKPLS